MQERPVRRTESHFIVPHVGALLRRAWLPPAPRRVLVLVHGLAEHSDRYDHVGAWFAARDCAVHAYDQRGHGRSAGLRCHVESFAELTDDLRALLSRIQSEHPGEPVTAVGHSMGGLVVAALLNELDVELAGAVLVAPALATPTGAVRFWAFLASCLARVAPRASLAVPIEASGLSRDPRVVRGYLEDPLVERRMSAGLAAELVSAMRRTARTRASLRVPLLLLHGEADRICAMKSSLAFHVGLSAPGSHLRTYPNLRHEIFNEPERERVFQDVLDWIVAQES